MLHLGALIVNLLSGIGGKVCHHRVSADFRLGGLGDNGGRVPCDGETACHGTMMDGVDGMHVREDE